MSRAKPKPSSGKLSRNKEKSDGYTEAAKENCDKEKFLLDMKVLRRAAEERTRNKSADKSVDHNLENTPFSGKESIVGPTMDFQKVACKEISRSPNDGSANETGHYPSDLNTTRIVWLVRAFHEGDRAQRQQIAAALGGSPLVMDAISDLQSESREKTYVAFSLLFTLAKSGELKPLLTAVETHPSIEVRLELVKLLALSQHPDVIPALRALASANSLDPEVRLAAQEVISQTSRLAGSS